MIQVRKQIDHHTTVLALTGQFDQQATVGFKFLILGVHEKGCQHVILDFSGLTEIDSKGIGELLYWYHNIKPYFVQVSIVNPPTPIWNQLDMGHVSELIPIYASQEEATWNDVPYS